MDRRRKAREEGSSMSEQKGSRSEKVARREKRCFDNHKVYNKIAGKCKPCEPCGYGKGRDFSNLAHLERDDVDGSHVCPPCQDCPDGTYNNAKLSVTCQNCVVNCKARNRMVQEECWIYGDTICGSCEKGYQESYPGNNDMPCEEISRSQASTVRVHVTDRLLRNASTSAQLQLPENANNGYKVGQSEKLPSAPISKTMITGLTVSGIVGSCLLVFVLAVVGCRYLRKRRRESKTQHRRRNGLNRQDSRSVEPILAVHGFNASAMSSARSSFNNLSHDNDIEFDAVGETVGEKIAQYHRQHSREGQLPYRVNQSQARGEMSGNSVPYSAVPRPELSRANTAEHSTEIFLGLHEQTNANSPGSQAAPEFSSFSTSLLSSSTDTQVFPERPRADHSQEARAELQTTCTMRDACGRDPTTMYPTQTAAVHDSSTHQVATRSSKRHCKCSPAKCRLCSEPLSNTCANLPVTKNCAILSEVATSVCHNPIHLYQKLCIPDADIYLIDDDRNRDPERIPENENIIKMLKRWIELKGSSATLPVLCTALCDTDFHGITEKIHIKRNVQNNES